MGFLEARTFEPRIEERIGVCKDGEEGPSKRFKGLGELRKQDAFREIGEGLGVEVPRLSRPPGVCPLPTHPIASRAWL